LDSGRWNLDDMLPNFFLSPVTKFLVWKAYDGTSITAREHNRAVFTSHTNPKYFLFHPSHQIFERMHGALNIDKKDN
jgi:hypothetical protein